MISIMMAPSPTSRQQYRKYRKDFRAHRTEGSKRTAAAHAEQTRDREDRRSFLQLFLAFFHLIRGHRGTVAIALCTVTIATGLKLVPPAAVGFVMDNVLSSDALPSSYAVLGAADISKRTLLIIVVIILVLTAALSTGIGTWGRYLNTVATKRVQSQMRKRVFEHAIRLPLHRVQQLKSGGVASILREDAGGVAELLFSMFYNPWRAIVQLLATLVILAVIDWRLLIGALVLIPIIYFTHKAWIGRIRPLWRDIRATRQHVDSHATEAFGGMRVVRSFGRQRTETGRFLRNNNLLIRQELQAWIASRSIEVTWAILIPVATASLLWYGGNRILTDAELVRAGTLDPSQALTTGSLVTFLLYLVMLMEPLATLASSATAFQNSLAGLDRVLDLLAEKREFQTTQSDRTEGRVIDRGAAGSPVLLSSTSGHFQLRELVFSYPGTDLPALRDITLDVPAGQTLALVGPSGAGKTTFCNLIARFYDPSAGSITLDGVDLRDIDVERYRRRLGIVEQDIFLFDGTIGENIAYGKRGAIQEEIVLAAEMANAVEFIDQLKHGYDTLIGERGVRLSGGQRQRLAIARALLADPAILILDEATSSLDTHSERFIQESLRTLLAGRTSFVIAHRLSTIIDADHIVVLDDGCIIEQGTHTELMEHSGRYREMVKLQLCPTDITVEERSDETDD